MQLVVLRQIDRLSWMLELAELDGRTARLDGEIELSALIVAGSFEPGTR